MCVVSQCGASSDTDLVLSFNSSTEAIVAPLTPQQARAICSAYGVTPASADLADTTAAAPPPAPSVRPINGAAALVAALALDTRSNGSAVTRGGYTQGSSKADIRSFLRFELDLKTTTTATETPAALATETHAALATETPAALVAILPSAPAFPVTHSPETLEVPTATATVPAAPTPAVLYEELTSAVTLAYARLSPEMIALSSSIDHEVAAVMLATALAAIVSTSTNSTDYTAQEAARALCAALQNWGRL